MEKGCERGRRAGVWLGFEVDRRRLEADLVIEEEVEDVKVNRDAARESWKMEALDAIVQVRL